MSDFLDIKLDIDHACPKLSVVIKSKTHDDDVEGLITVIQEYANRRMPMIMAYFKGSVVMLPQRKICRFYISNRKVFVETIGRTYEVKMTLSDLGKMLDESRFIKISKSEIINLQMVESFDFSAAGTIEVEMKNGEITWVARRRIRDVKEAVSKMPECSGK